MHLGVLDITLGHSVRMMRMMMMLLLLLLLLLDPARRGGTHAGWPARMTRPHLTAVERVLRTVRAAKWAWSTM